MKRGGFLAGLLGALAAVPAAPLALRWPRAVVQAIPAQPVARIGAAAMVTDEMIARWTGAGQWRLADGELDRLIREAGEDRLSAVAQ